MNSLACTLTLMAFSFSLNIFCSFSFLKSFFCFSQPIIGQLKIEDLVRWKQKKFGIRKHNLNGVEKIKIRNTREWKLLTILIFIGLEFEKSVCTKPLYRYQKKAKIDLIQKVKFKKGNLTLLKLRTYFSRFDNQIVSRSNNFKLDKNV